MGHEVLFCPFCRDSHEGIERCPEHDLLLVPLSALPPREESTELDLDASLGFSLGHGRGALLLVALSLLATFFGPDFVEISRPGQPPQGSTAFALTERALNLWSIPFVAMTWVSLILRGGTLRQLRSIRLASAFLGLIPVASTIFTLVVIRRSSAQLQAIGSDLNVSTCSGAVIIMSLGVAGLILSLWRLGRLKTREEGPQRPAFKA